MSSDPRNLNIDRALTVSDPRKRTIGKSTGPPLPQARRPTDRRLRSRTNDPYYPQSSNDYNFPPSITSNPRCPSSSRNKRLLTRTPNTKHMFPPGETNQTQKRRFHRTSERKGKNGQKPKEVPPTRPKRTLSPTLDPRKGRCRLWTRGPRDVGVPYLHLSRGRRSDKRRTDVDRTWTVPL